MATVTSISPSHADQTHRTGRALSTNQASPAKIIDFDAASRPASPAKLKQLLAWAEGRRVPSKPNTPAIPSADKTLELLVYRLHLKAEAIRWLLERRRLLSKGPEFKHRIQARDRALSARANQFEQCALWMCAPKNTTRHPKVVWEKLAAAFENAAFAAVLLAEARLSPVSNHLPQAMQLAAQAQSALNAAADAVAAKDRDQARLFQYLRRSAKAQNIFIERYMRIDDPADPAVWRSLEAQLEKLDERMQRAENTTARNKVENKQCHNNKQLPQSTAVKRAAALLKGRKLVFIGGKERRYAAEALMRSFGVKEVIWLGKPHQSHTDFQPAIARPEVALVLLAIRWSSHAFSGIKPFCDQYNKPLIRLPAGYNPEQVAQQILSQASDQLRAAS